MIRGLTAGFSCLLLGSIALAQESEIKKTLTKEIIGPRQTLIDLQKFIHPRIPSMPEINDQAKFRAYAKKVRQDVLEKVVLRGEAKKWYDASTKVKWFESMPGGPGYRLKKVRFEALPGMWIPALLYEPEKLEGKVPATLNVMGHDRGGKDVGYQQIRCINLAKRGMLALNVEWFSFGQLAGEDYRHYRMNQLDLCGSSGIAPFYLALKRGLDVLLSHPNADPKRVAVSGLSGGGWQTAFISGIDERVTLANPVAGYSSFMTRLYHFSDLGDSEQTPCDLATVADYAHLTAIRAPNPALLTFNAKDQCCFASGHALAPLLESSGPFYRLFKAGKALRGHVNQDPGTHNYELDNRQAFYRMIGDFFYAGDSSYRNEEIPCQDEVRHAKDLLVPMPKTNATFHSLATELAKNLPVVIMPADPAQGKNWLELRRLRLGGIVKPVAFEVTGDGKASAMGAVTVRSWQLLLKDKKPYSGFHVPVVEFSPQNPKATYLVLHDEGRAASAATMDRLLMQGNRVLALDPFYFGECKVAERPFLFALLVAAVGERPLGIQAGQIQSVARWFADEQKTGPVHVVAVGPRTGLMALSAAALTPHTFASVEVDKSYSSLKVVIERNLSVDQQPEMFCFGLLRDFDIVHLSLMAGNVRFANADKQLLHEIATWSMAYKKIGALSDSSN